MNIPNRINWHPQPGFSAQPSASARCATSWHAGWGHVQPCTAAPVSCASIWPRAALARRGTVFGPRE
jgi:hypothetical protein